MKTLPNFGSCFPQLLSYFQYIMLSLLQITVVGVMSSSESDSYALQSGAKGARVCAEVVAIFAVAKVLLTGLTLAAVGGAVLAIGSAAAFGFALGFGITYLLERPWRRSQRSQSRREPS